MEWLQKLPRLFEQHPELVYVSAFIVLLVIVAFGYLIINFLVQRSRAKKSPAPESFEQLPLYEETRKDAATSDAVGSLTVIANNPLHAGPKDSTHLISVLSQEAVTKPSIVHMASAPTATATAPARVKAKVSSLGRKLFRRGRLKPAPQNLITAIENKIDQPEVSDDPYLLAEVPEQTPVWSSVEEQIEVQTDTAEREQNVALPDVLSDPLRVATIGYQPNDFYAKHSGHYPIVRMPKPNAVIRLPRKEESRIRGQKEAGFQQMLEDAFPHCLITGTLCVPTSSGSRPYYPGIVLCIKEANVYLDIEIDEPYAAHKRTPMHCTNDDLLRDNWLTNRGWMVIRFSERQVAREAEKCVAFVAKVLHSVDPKFVIPAFLKNLEEPTREPQWTQAQAYAWEKQGYRESYLGIQVFGRATDPGQPIGLWLSNGDIAAEQLVAGDISLQPAQAAPAPFNVQHIHPRDVRIGKHSSGSTFLVDGFPVHSVAALVDSYFPATVTSKSLVLNVDTTGVARNEERPQDLFPNRQQDAMEQLVGDIENYFEACAIATTPEFAHFQRFLQQCPFLNPYRSQWHIFDELNHVGGTVDLVLQNEAGSFDLVAWERNDSILDDFERPVLKNQHHQCGIGLLRHLQDTPFNRSCLKQNILRYILENRYGLPVRHAHLLVLHPDLQQFVKVHVQPMMAEAELVISPPF
jgi:hypothetical protein